MQRTYFALVLMMGIGSLGSVTHAQVDTTQTAPTYLIVTQDGGEFVGTLLSDDSREVVIETKDLGRVTIPKYQIKEMRVLEAEHISTAGRYIREHIFATRYFLTTNGLPVKKNESYVQWSLYGPSFQVALRPNMSIGLITSWVGMPIIGTFKYSTQLATQTSLGFGTLLGTGSWASPEFGLAVPFAALTWGDRRTNVNLSLGYGSLWANGNADGTVLLSLASMVKLERNMSFVFDSIIVPDVDSGSTFALLIPGIRFQENQRKAIQIGFAGIVADGDAVPYPLPTVQLYRKY